MSPDPHPIQWRKARSSQGNGNCVEIGAAPGKIAIRDSKNPYSGNIMIGRSAFRGFAAQLRTDHHDR